MCELKLTRIRQFHVPVLHMYIKNESTDSKVSKDS